MAMTMSADHGWAGHLQELADGAQARDDDGHHPRPARATGERDTGEDEQDADDDVPPSPPGEVQQDQAPVDDGRVRVGPDQREEALNQVEDAVEDEDDRRETDPSDPSRRRRDLSHVLSLPVQSDAAALPDRRAGGESSPVA